MPSKQVNQVRGYSASGLLSSAAIAGRANGSLPRCGQTRKPEVWEDNLNSALKMTNWCITKHSEENNLCSVPGKVRPDVSHDERADGPVASGMRRVAKRPKTFPILDFRLNALLLLQIKLAIENHKLEMLSNSGPNASVTGPTPTGTTRRTSPPFGTSPATLGCLYWAKSSGPAASTKFRRLGYLPVSS